MCLYGYLFMWLYVYLVICLFVYSVINKSPDNQITNFIFCWLSVYMVITKSPDNQITNFIHLLSCVSFSLLSLFPISSINGLCLTNDSSVINSKSSAAIN